MSQPHETFSLIVRTFIPSSEGDPAPCGVRWTRLSSHPSPSVLRKQQRLFEASFVAAGLSQSELYFAIQPSSQELPIGFPRHFVDSLRDTITRCRDQSEWFPAPSRFHQGHLREPAITPCPGLRPWAFESCDTRPLRPAA